MNPRILKNLQNPKINRKQVRREFYRETISKNPYIPHDPTVKQTLYSLLPQKEAFYGGAGGGGKSDALLMGALQYVGVPGYSALLLRRTYSDLSLPGALMDRATQWLGRPELKAKGIAPHWDGLSKTWTFPSGATLTFGYLKSEVDKYRYQSAEFQFIGFDELTQFTETQYRYLFSRLRKLKGFPVPLRMRSASNPGGLGHDWVKRRFITIPKKLLLRRPFIPARLQDNPYIDQHSYVGSLNELDPVTRAQLLNGDWDVLASGNFFKRAYFAERKGTLLHELPLPSFFVDMVRYWDLAGSVPSDNYPDPDWTVGTLLGLGQDGRYYVLDVKRFRGTPKTVKDTVASVAFSDAQTYGLGVRIQIEKEGATGGKVTIDDFTDILDGYNFEGVPSVKNKPIRAGPVSSCAEAGNLVVCAPSNAIWFTPWIDELTPFPCEGLHDDQVDSLSGAYNGLHLTGSGREYRGNPSIAMA